jgi:hypothetical protein
MAGGEPAGGRRAGGRKDGGRLATSADGRHQPPPQLTLALGEGEVRGRQTGSVRAGGGGDPWRRPALVVEAGEERGWRRRRRPPTLAASKDGASLREKEDMAESRGEQRKNPRWGVFWIFGGWLVSRSS